MRKGQSGNIHIYVLKTLIRNTVKVIIYKIAPERRNEEKAKVHLGQSSWTRCGRETVKMTPSMFSCLIFIHSRFVVGPKRKIQFALYGARRNEVSHFGPTTGSGPVRLMNLSSGDLGLALTFRIYLLQTRTRFSRNCKHIVTVRHLSQFFFSSRA